MTVEELKAFEAEVAEAFNRGMVKAPIHLSDGNEAQLLEIFKEVKPTDWIFSTWRSHFHCLLKGVPREQVMADILAGRSMMLHYQTHRVFTSAIVGGILPIACGVAYALQQASSDDWVWVFVGDMTASLGAFQDAQKYAAGHDLPIRFVVEDNGLATNTPTAETWGRGSSTMRGIAGEVRRYSYTRSYPHVGSGVYVAF